MGCKEIKKESKDEQQVQSKYEPVKQQYVRLEA